MNPSAVMLQSMNPGIGKSIGSPNSAMTALRSRPILGIYAFFPAARLDPDFDFFGAAAD